MNIMKCNQATLSRRNFMLTALVAPLLIELLLSPESLAADQVIQNNIEERFVFLDGWVLLEVDLIEQRS